MKKCHCQVRKNFSSPFAYITKSGFTKSWKSSFSTSHTEVFWEHIHNFIMRYSFFISWHTRQQRTREKVAKSSSKMILFISHTHFSQYFYYLKKRKKCRRKFSRNCLMRINLMWRDSSMLSYTVIVCVTLIAWVKMKVKMAKLITINPTEDSLFII